MKTREKLFSVTKKDCIFKYYRGSGPGGQKRNKTENCCQCTHKASGAQASSEDGKSKEQNMKQAFKRMSNTDTFKKWVRIEAARATGELARIEATIDKEMQENVQVDVKENGRWIKEN